MAGSNLQMSHPMSVKEISQKATDFQFNPFIPLKYWLRTADSLLREAYIYEREHNNAQAYLLLMRYAALVADKLSEHPAARLPENRSALKAVQKTLPEVLNRLEMLKPRIEMRYNSWQKTLERRKETAAALEGERPPSRSRQEYSFSDPAVAGNNMTLAAAENSELAVKMAHKEIRRRDAVRLASRHPGASSEKEQERRTAGLWDDWEAALSQNGRHSSLHDDQIRLDMEASRRRLDSQHDISLEGLGLRPPKGPPRNVRPEQRFGEKSDLRQSSHTEYRYPSIAKSQPLTSQNNEYDSQARPKSPRRASLPPKPPKERLDSSVSPVLPPRRPEKLTTEPVNLPPVSNSGGPSSYTFAPSAYLENGNPLRTVFLPPTLREQFLAHAASNTRRNLETCGMLCGTLMSNALFISKVVIPEQESTSDTCETINESAFFDYCAAEDLMVLGWIHTHPTQTCFMSSRDLHTHCGYQIMMPESIAIVCAPSKTPSWGVFRLTDPPGMQSVLNCRKTGLFHPHDETNVYTDALRPGHVCEAEGMEFSVVDLRP